MASFAPLRPGDPPRLGGLHLLGRLGEGGQGVVYLAEDHSGAKVAVKWLRPDLSGDQVSVERFLREVQVAQQVAAFCTAAVLGTGVEHDRPFIVSEFIEGPSLQRIVQEEGPRTGSVLHRLAIGTATALAAIHQAGIVHRDFKPANVIIGTDGPRVIDFGIARALNATSTISSMVVGTPSYMPPEQIMGHSVGPAADLFSWASTMVFAASGQAPFGSDTMPAVINRVLTLDPDLNVLNGTLREVVAACLSKDPARRPTAEQVIMRLLQHSAPSPGSVLAQAAAEAAPRTHRAPQPQTPSGAQQPQASHAALSYTPPTIPPPAGHTAPPGTFAPMSGAVPRSGPGQPPWQPPAPPYGPPTYQRPPKRGRGPLIAGITVAVALLMLAGVITFIQLDKSSVASRQTSATPTSTTSRTRTKPSATQTPVPPAGEAKKLPGADVSLYENPADALVLTSYEIYDKGKKEWIDYARSTLHGSFTSYPGNMESMVSPDGRYLASRGKRYTNDRYDFIVITDRQSGRRTTIKTVRDPLAASIRAWSKDGARILLSIDHEIEDDEWVYPGFVIIDVARKKATVVNVSDATVRKTAFGFDDQDKGVVNVYGDEDDRGLRYFDISGRVTRSQAGIGTLYAGTQDIFSPSGRTFVTNCADGADGDHCIWDVSSGKRVRKFYSDCDKVLGFYDEDHLYCWENDNGDKDEVQVVDFKGRLVRKLLAVADEVQISPVFTINPSKGS